MSNSLHNCAILVPSQLRSSTRWRRTRTCLISTSRTSSSRGCLSQSLPQKIVISQYETTVPPSKLRPSTNFHPDVWGHRFIHCTPTDDDNGDDRRRAHREEEIEQLKKHVREELTVNADPGATNVTGGCLELIDNIQRLSLAYHFEKEIQEILQHVYEVPSDDDQDMYVVSLRFRLLRQQGFDCSSDVFNKFTDENGKFKEPLTGDMKGLLSLYEAAYFAKPEGDEILDEALAFTVPHLRFMAKSDNNHSSDPNLVSQIAYALDYPLLKSMPRLEARHYIPIYENQLFHDAVLLKLAKLDFNHVQLMHKQDIIHLVRWWKDKDMERKAPYARSRVVELYFWAVCMYFEPQFQLARRLLTKLSAVSSVLDDTYDNYATFEELQLLTAAIERWSRDCTNQLPENLRACYELLLDTFDEVEQEMATVDRSYHTPYAKRAMKQLVQGYFEQQKWLNEGYSPSVEEYMSCSLQSSSYATVPILALVCRTDAAVTKETLDWFESVPNILVAGGRIARILDDIGSHKFEQEREHIESAVEIYMKQYKMTEKRAIDELRVEIHKAWKEMNGELILKHVPFTLLEPTVNLTRGASFTYLNGDDGYTNVGPRTRKAITSLFTDPIPI